MIKCKVYVVSAILSFIDIRIVLRNIHYLCPCVLEHFAVDMQVKIFLSCDYSIRRGSSNNVGIDYCIVVSLFGVENKMQNEFV